MDTRTRERLYHHYQVEKELATRLKNASRAERATMLSTLYTELFERVPDHPRLTRLETPDTRTFAVERRMRLLQPALGPETTLLEIAPGDCLPAYEACKMAKKVIAADISDQRGDDLPPEPENFEMLLYDGFELPLPDDSVDLVFTYQFLEHLHPEDVITHLQLVLRVLKPGGAYIFSTPHRYSGPHDVSRHFSQIPEGFHLKEWTHAEFFHLFRQIGYSQAWAMRQGRPLQSPLANAATCAAETVLGLLPQSARRKIADKILPNVVMLARK